MGSKEAILQYLPVWAQNVLISAYGYKLVKQRYGRIYKEHRAELISRMTWSHDELRVEQDRLLRDFVRFAARSSPLYQELYQGIDLSEIKGVEDLHKLPILEKEHLRANVDKAYTVSPEDGISAFTGGTTGKSLKVIFTVEDFQRRMAHLDVFKLSLGVDPFAARKATFNGREFTRGWATERSGQYWRMNWAYNQRLYSTFDINERTAPLYIDDLNKFQPEALNGFVSALDELGRLVEELGLQVRFTPRAIFTTSESLLAHHRERIERVFGAPVYDQYASGEGAPFITECRHRQLHYQLDTGVIETIGSGAGAEILVTSFTTHGTPLIRYRIGDRVIFKDGECSCGSMHPLVESISGRQVDFLISKEHGMVSLSHLADVIKGLPNCIKNVQFHQHDPGSLQVHMCVDEGLYDDSMQEKIVNALIYRFGAETSFEFVLVDEIPREKSGKYALIKNHMAS